MDRTTQITRHCPEALSRRRLDGLIAAHETAADDLSSALSALLRSPVEVAHGGTAQMPYGDFLARLGNTTYIHVFRTASDDAMLLEIELPALYPMLDRLLGGCGDDDRPTPRRPLSDIEQPLAARLVRAIVRHLPPPFNDENRLIESDRAESNPRLIRAMPADEMAVAAEFQLDVGSHRGMMRLCLPCRTVSPPPDDSPSDENAGRAADSPTDDGDFVDSTSTVEICVTLASTPIRAAELRSLRVGDIVATETSADEPAVVSLCGEPKYLAKPGVRAGRKAIRIASSI